MDTACDIKVIQSGPKSETTLIVRIFNPLKGTVKPQSNGPLFSNTVIGTLAVDKWAVTFGTTRRGLGGLRRIPLLAVPRPVFQLHIIRWRNHGN